MPFWQTNMAHSSTGDFPKKVKSVNKLNKHIFTFNLQWKITLTISWRAVTFKTSIDWRMTTFRRDKWRHKQQNYQENRFHVDALLFLFVNSSELPSKNWNTLVLHWSRIENKDGMRQIEYLSIRWLLQSIEKKNADREKLILAKHNHCWNHVFDNHNRYNFFLKFRLRPEQDGFFIFFF